MIRTISPVARSKWIEGVLADATLTTAARCTAVRLAMHLNLESGRLNPSMDTLADGTGQKRRAVAGHITALETQGWIRRISTQGRHSNSYELIIKPVPAMHDGAQLTVHDGAPFDRSNRARRCTVTVHGSVFEPCTAMHTEQGKRKNREKNRESYDRDDDLFVAPADEQIATKPTAKKTATGRSEFEERFAEFWSAYPRKVAKPDAKKAFAQAVTSGKATAEQIIAGAMRYAAAKTGADPRYIKHPCGWLRDERWNDQPAEHQPIASLQPPRPRHSNGTSTAVDAILGSVGRRRTPDE